MKITNIDKNFNEWTWKHENKHENSEHLSCISGFIYLGLFYPSKRWTNSLKIKVSLFFYLDTRSLKLKPFSELRTTKTILLKLYIVKSSGLNGIKAIILKKYAPELGAYRKYFSGNKWKHNVVAQFLFKYSTLSISTKSSTYAPFTKCLISVLHILSNPSDPIW